MTSHASQLQPIPLRAPQEDGTALVEPPFAELGAMVAANAGLGAEATYDFHGRPLADLRRQARRELLREARSWTRSYRDTGPSGAVPGDLVFLAGHQPQLFHPGVWLKNFALGTLAERYRATAVNLLIDSDTVGNHMLKVPGGSPAAPRCSWIPFDRPEPTLSYEDRRIADREMFVSFGRRAAEQIAPLVADPLIHAYWPLAQQRLRHTDNLGACLAQSRHQLEGQWGLDTLEVPQSRICDTDSFCWFMLHLLSELPRLWEIYNEAVGEYRRAHRIRNMAQPVPNLSAAGAWLEAPLWISCRQNPHRRRLFARRRGKEILLSDRQQLQACLPLSPDGPVAPALARLKQLRAEGVKIRTRALMTTLWARLLLGDLFVHGIGGAKYDQVTDVLIERFFGLSPPGFMVLSATLLLPVQRPQVTPERSRHIRQQLRELEYHPEQYIDGSCRSRFAPADGPSGLIAAKNRWVRTPQTPQNARARCRGIRQINEALQPWVAARRERLQRELAETLGALRTKQILGWREYGFCLYPESTLRRFLARLLPKNA